MTKKGRLNSRNKGANFERLVAKLLTDWWGVKFSRSPQSGGLHWSKDSRVTGDIVPPVDIDFPFTIECKKQEGWDFSQILSKKGDIKQWWEQCINDFRRLDDDSKNPLLVFSKNHYPIYYIMLTATYQRLEPEGVVFNTSIEIGTGERFDVTVGLFEDLRKLPAEVVMKNLKGE